MSIFRNASRAFLIGVMLTVIALPLATQQPVAQKASVQAAARHTIDMTPVKPESVGFSSARLERLHALMLQTVDEKHLAGIVTILARHGKIVDYRTYGARDMASKTPMAKDTIFRDYSMTKPVTGVAMMILYEQGKWLPSDPISKYIPEFAHLKVYQGMDADGKMILVDPDHAPTMRELMTHTAGFSYGNGKTQVDAMYGDLHVRQSKNLQEMIERLAKIPLHYQPGQGWIYSMSMDIEGYIVEKLSGQSLPAFMRDQIFKPLGMRDAAFYVSEANRGRFATLYQSDGHGGLELDTSNGHGMGDFLSPPGMPSGGGGLTSTAEDYYRFAQMLANRGELNGARILAPATVRLMTSNHLPEKLLTGEFGIGLQQMRPGFGYGYNGAVVYDPPEANLPDGKGTYLWDGAAGTWFWVDPANDIVFVGMIQRLNGGSPNVEYLSRNVVYQALVDPSK
ncbi:MAG TPA: serine hydrolase domain-containing protein [Terracidiphilus sp.]|jgi:CubicO group peptidase (beta-lactamase class C family)|nr:serine hydrolase domain-containing protein [Terracidiphilus sp.]